jgi:hypothetical protein
MQSESFYSYFYNHTALFSSSSFSTYQIEISYSNFQEFSILHVPWVGREGWREAVKVPDGYVRLRIKKNWSN